MVMAVGPRTKGRGENLGAANPWKGMETGKVPPL